MSMSTQAQIKQNGTATEMTPEKAFAEGDLGRVQGLLFGDQFDAINGRLDAMEAMILDSIGAIRSEMRKEITATQKKIDKNKAQVNKRLDAKIEKESSARKVALTNIADAANAESSELKTDLATTAAAFEKSLDALKHATEKAVAANRSSFDKKLRDTEQQLASSKVDRNTLADLLSTTAAQLGDAPAPKKVRRVA